jgi:hypothetical protein
MARMVFEWKRDKRHVVTICMRKYHLLDASRRSCLGCRDNHRSVFIEDPLQFGRIACTGHSKGERFCQDSRQGGLTCSDGCRAQSGSPVEGREGAVHGM